MDKVTCEADQTTAEGMSSHGMVYVTEVRRKQGARGHGMGSMRVEHAAYDTTPPSVGPASANMGECKTFLL